MIKLEISVNFYSFELRHKGYINDVNFYPINFNLEKNFAKISHYVSMEIYGSRLLSGERAGTMIIHRIF